MDAPWQRNMRIVFDDVMALQKELLPRKQRRLFTTTPGNGYKILYLRRANYYNHTLMGNMTLHLPVWEWNDDARTITIGTCYQPGPGTMMRVEAEIMSYVSITVGRNPSRGRIECSWKNGHVRYAKGVRNALKRIGFY